ncbi:hypothetical protein [Tepidiforma sp.]|uniref:hypothetical protein n=1 Tax=Tepidiforma sp. TaxID=2682230 RepID=UPI002ADDDD5D|nr:hypothetical protein [Tepidiforma sp.]
MAVRDASTPRIVDSLLGAADRLERARTSRATRNAIRDCALALEFRLDTLARELDPAQSFVDPALYPAARRIEGELRALLIEAWKLLKGGDAALADPRRIAEFAREARRVASDEAAFAFSQLSTPQALD